MQASSTRLLAAFAVSFATQAALAQTAEQQLPEVKVRAAAETATSPVQGYSAQRSATATKTDTPLLETPQAVTVVTRDQIEDQGANTLQEALNYAAGVRSDAYGLDSRSDNISVRGGTPVEYRDGLRRQLTGYYTSTIPTEPYGLERIEVLRGPSAMLYGLGSTAGVVNLVSKRPLAESYREVGVQIGSFDRKQVQADLTGRLTADGEWLYRLVALARNADTQVDYVPNDREYFAPSLTWRPSAATSLTFQFLWQKDRSGSTSQFLPWEGTILPNPNGQVPTNRFIGEPALDRYDSNRTEVGWLFEHRLDERWTLHQSTRFTDNHVDYFSLYGDAFFTNPGHFADSATGLLNRFAFFEKRDANGFAADQFLEGRLTTGAIRHQVLLGLEYQQHKEHAMSASDNPPGYPFPPNNVPPINAYNPVYGTYTILPELAALPNTRLNQTGIYLQDQMKIDRWIVVAGVRQDRVVNSLEGSSDQVDAESTMRAGLMHVFDGGLAPYMSYSESFTPIAGIDFFNQRYKPLRGEQVEAGVKWQPVGRRLTATAAVYELKEKNRQVTDPIHPNSFLQVGQSKTNGAELELVGRVLPWLDIAAHYNFLDQDPQLEQMPEHQASVWASGRLALSGLAGLRWGLGVRYFSSFKDGPADGDAPTVPAATLYDGMLGYDTGPWRFALNAQNLADKIYFSTCLARGDCWYGTRRNVILSARYQF
jgi:iron complex outermembrane recepter protein